MATPSNEADVDRGGGPGSSRHRGTRNHQSRDAAALLSFVTLACWVTGRLWYHPTHGLADNKTDQSFFEWMLAHGARVVTGPVNPFLSYQMNVPDGVNLMANTSVLGISVPLAPVTLLFGPHVAFNVFLTLALIATPAAWYLVLNRAWGFSRGAAWLGAAFCGFAPGMISQATGHPNIVAQFVVPLIIWRTLRLREPGRWRRNGLLLGLLVVWQAFINLEVLLMTAVGVGIFLAVAVVARRDLRRDARPFAAGLGTAGAVAIVVLAYPLYVQFFGPQAYHGLPAYIRAYGADLASFVAFSRESIAGSAASARGLAQNPSEENAFFGWPLAILVGGLVLWLRRNVAALGLAATGLCFAILSLGTKIRFNGHPIGIPGPWRILSDLPVLDSVVPTRWALAIAPVIGLLLALGWERVRHTVRRHPPAARPLRLAAATVLAMALLPIAPTALPSREFTPTPAFISTGTWRKYVTGDRTVVTLPLPDSHYAAPLRWSAQTGQALRLARGYFLGPNRDPGRPADRTALFSAAWRPTASLFNEIRRTGRMPRITDQNRAEAIADLRYWRAAVVILAPGEYEDVYRRAMTELTGLQPVRLGGVWLWDVRPLVG